MSDNYFKDNADLLYYFERGLDLEAIYAVTEALSAPGDGFTDAAEATAFYREIGEMVGEFAATEIAPIAAKVDRVGVRLEDGEIVVPPELERVFARLRERDLHGMCVPRELGGMNAPFLLYFVTGELFARADVSVLSHHAFHGGIALSMLLFSVEEGSARYDSEARRLVSTRFDREISEIARGEAWGAMDITEPDAGSDMAELRTTAQLGDDGVWRVSGQKIFITEGHGKYHFVIARSEPRTGEHDGLAGLSMFLVPTYSDEAGRRVRHATVERIEEKLGHHGSATCAIHFDESPATLVGRRGEGFRYMLYMMNNARLGVAFECLGLLEAAYRSAGEYAAGRSSMGKPIAQHEMIADYLDEMRSDIEGLRALSMKGAYHQELAARIGIRLKLDDRLGELERKRLEREQRRHALRARRITPLVKYFGAERAVEHTRRALQIHGGNGYTKDYVPEKLLRDALVMPIYEGTSQIQSLMAMKDTLASIMRNPQAFLRRLAETRWLSLSARDPLERRVAKVRLHSLNAQQYLLARTAGAKVKSLRERPLAEWRQSFVSGWDPKRDFAHAMLHAERLTRLLTEDAICRALLDQAKRHEERRDVLARYLERAEGRARFLHDEITTTGDRLLSALGARHETLDRAIRTG